MTEHEERQFVCPRCGTTSHEESATLSRRDNRTSICGDCGREESEEDTGLREEHLGRRYWKGVESKATGANVETRTDSQVLAADVLQRFAEEAKTIVLLAFRNGPLEDLHAGRVCPHCAEDAAVSHVSNAQMKKLMKFAVDKTFQHLVLRTVDPEAFAARVERASDFTAAWDPPESD